MQLLGAYYGTTTLTETIETPYWRHLGDDRQLSGWRGPLNLKIFPKIPAFLTRPITIPPYRWTIFLVFCGTLVGVLVFSGWYAWFSWHRYKQDSQYHLALGSDMVAAVTQKLLDGHASGLQFLGGQLQRADAVQHPRRARTLRLDYLKATPDIASANLIAPSGQVIASTAVPAGKPLPDFRNNPAIWPVDGHFWGNFQP